MCSGWFRLGHPGRAAGNGCVVAQRRHTRRSAVNTANQAGTSHSGRSRKAKPIHSQQSCHGRRGQQAINLLDSTRTGTGRSVRCGNESLELRGQVGGFVRAGGFAGGGPDGCRRVLGVTRGELFGASRPGPVGPVMQRRGQVSRTPLERRRSQIVEGPRRHRARVDFAGGPVTVGPSDPRGDGPPMLAGGRPTNVGG